MSKTRDQPIVDWFETRNKEIGAILAEARQQQNRTVTECADLIATSRRRYSAIERGAAAVNAVELEVLMRFLNIPAQHIWRDLVPAETQRQVIVQAHPGERVQLVVEVQK